MRPPATTLVTDRRVIGNTSSFTFSASDPQSGVAETWLRLGEFGVRGAWQQGETIEVPVPDYQTTDKEYLIGASSKDNYGNWEEETTTAVVTDVEAPKPYFEPKKTDMLGEWINHASYVRLWGNDGIGSGVRRVVVRRDGGPARAHTDAWVCVTKAPLTHENDGVHTIRMHAVDKLGHVSKDATRVVKIDTRKPRTQIKVDDDSGIFRLVHIFLNGNASVRCAVYDAKPCGSRCTVTIRIRNKAGKTWTVTSPDKLPIGRMATAHFTWKFGHGTFTVSVRGRDTAGNVGNWSTTTWAVV